MVSAPVVGSTVPVTSDDDGRGSLSPRILAASLWTAVLPSSWTGSGKVTGDDWPPDWVLELICTCAVDWYFGFATTLEYPTAATTATTTLTRMVSFRRQSVERNWWMVSGRSLSAKGPGGEMAVEAPRFGDGSLQTRIRRRAQ